MYPLLEVRGLKREVGGRVVLTDINFQLETHGDILFVRGPSGVGKSLLLRALACLDHSEGGTVLLHGRPPSALGYPSWRTRVAYVPQSRPSTLSGTPAELYALAQQLGAQRQRPRGDLPSLVHEMGLEQRVLHQQWGELSGGQSQRAALAIAVALCPEVLLLDEPTAACDPASTLKVERVLRTCGAALVWVTHDPAQAQRVGGRLLSLPLGAVTQLPPPPPPPLLLAEPAAVTPPGSASPFSRQQQHKGQGPGERGDGPYDAGEPARPEAAQGASLLLLGDEELEGDSGGPGGGGGARWEERGQAVSSRAKGGGVAGGLALGLSGGMGRGAVGAGAVDVQQQGQQGQGQQHGYPHSRNGLGEGAALNPVMEGAVGEDEEGQDEEGQAGAAVAVAATAAAPGDGHGAGAPQRRSWLALMGGSGGGSSGGAGGAAAAAAAGSGGGAVGGERGGAAPEEAELVEGGGAVQGTSEAVAGS